MSDRFDSIDDKIDAMENAITIGLKALSDKLFEIAKMVIKSLFGLFGLVIIFASLIVAILLIKDSNKNLSAAVGPNHLAIESGGHAQ